MRLRCPKCNTLYEYDEDNLTEILEKYNWKMRNKTDDSGDWICPNCREEEK